MVALDCLTFRIHNTCLKAKINTYANLILTQTKLRLGRTDLYLVPCKIPYQHMNLLTVTTQHASSVSHLFLELKLVEPNDIDSFLSQMVVFLPLEKTLMSSFLFHCIAVSVLTNHYPP